MKIVSKTFDLTMKDDANRATLAKKAAEHLGIKPVDPVLMEIAAPVCEIAKTDEKGEVIRYREDVKCAISWDERSLKTMGVVYRYESAMSFIGLDGKTYMVPHDKPVLDHLVECGYVIAPYGAGLDGSGSTDTLISEDRKINRNLPPELVAGINKIEQGREYVAYYTSYNGCVAHGGTIGIDYCSYADFKDFSLTERKVCSLTSTSRKRVSDPNGLAHYVKGYLKESTYLDDLAFEQFCNTEEYSV